MSAEETLDEVFISNEISPKKEGESWKEAINRLLCYEQANGEWFAFEDIINELPEWLPDMDAGDVALVIQAVKDIRESSILRRNKPKDI